MFQRLALTSPGSMSVNVEAVAVSRQNGKKVRIKGKFTVEGSIGIHGRNGTTVLILKKNEKEYLLNWRYSTIKNFEPCQYVPSGPTLRKNKKFGHIWDTLSVRGSRATVKGIRRNTLTNSERYT